MKAMQTSVWKWGNSLALRLPRAMAADLNLVEGSAVELRVEGRAVVVTPVRRKHDLSGLLAGLKPEHRRSETEWGGAAGEEEW